MLSYGVISVESYLYEVDDVWRSGKLHVCLSGPYSCLMADILTREIRV